MDLDQGGRGYQRVRTYLGPSLGWSEELVQPATNITTGGTYVVQPGDSLLLVNFAGSVTIQLPDVIQWIQQTANQPATGFDRSITVKDFGGNASTFNIVVTPFGTQRIDGVQASTLISTPKSAIKLVPLIDLTGWTVALASVSGGGGGGGGDVFKAGNNTFVGINSFLNQTTAPTMTAGDSSTNVATTAFVATSFQPLDADLTALSGATGTNTIYYRSAPNTWSPVTIGTGLTFAAGVLSATAGPPPPTGVMNFSVLKQSGLLILLED